MGKIAFVFSGQGAQAPGMGYGFYEASERSREVFELADSIRPGLSEMCFNGSEEELAQTINTQPCLYTVEMAIAAAAEEAGLAADMCAGFSLGELSALTYAQAMSVPDGIKIVNARARFMQDCSERHNTSMAAVIKLSNEQIEQLCSSFDNIYPVNYNCPGQMSVSGDSEQMQLFAEAVKREGGRAKILKVNGAFHSPYMTPAADSFRKELENYEFAVPKICVYSNFTGLLYQGKNITPDLSSQINNPVRWETIVRNMIDSGADTFVELGPGKTLTGLIKRISTDVRLFNVSTPDDLEKMKGELG